MTASTAALSTLDPTDGLPTWDFDEGEEVLPGLRFWAPLGTGTRCETWLAWSTQLWTPVAVKLARPHQIDHPRARAALRREVAALAGVVHPVLPRLYTEGAAAPLPHIVLEYVDGAALDEELDASGPLDTVAAVLLGTQLLSGLLGLHARGLAHLDVKPDNVVIRDGRPVLIDFGSTRPIGSLPTAPGAIGTAGCTAPELEAGAPVTEAMDVFGLGRLLLTATRNEDTAVHAVATALTAPDPVNRPSVRAALDALAGCVEPGSAPWPGWAIATQG